MKKLNRKGFTLIELLAVVVIMAVILVVTIPSVIQTMNDAKEKQLQNTADSVAEWYTKQYENASYSLSNNSVSTAYTNFPPKANETHLFSETNGEAALKAAGVGRPAENIKLAESKLELKNDKICITLVAAEGGNFYNNNANGNTKTSAGC